MQDSIRRINNQQYTRETGSLLISEPKLELSVKKDEVVTGSVEVSLQSGQDFTGYVYSSDYRMQCKRKKISGGKAMLSYQFDASGLECGDVRKGEICIVTGFGMFFLPFQAEVKRKTIQSSLGPIKNLFHFVNLAKTHWEEAVSIFYGDAFEDILVGADRQYLAAYIGLSKYKYNEQNMDEFLLLTNKKQMQSFRLVEQEAVLDTSLQQMGGELCVERNGWGYTYVELSALGDFIRLDRKALTEEDFSGTRCNISFGIREEKLHDGKNYGSIVLKSRDGELTFPVTVIMTRAENRRSIYGKEERRLVLEMMQHYIRFRTGRLEREKWLEESEKSTQQMTNHHAGSMRARLYQAHILLLKERANEAKWILNHVAEQLEQGQGDDREYAYYLYLTYLYEQNDESAAKVRRELKRLYREHPHDFWFYWLLLETDEDLKADKENVYRELEALFKRGANSPVLYLEAYRILESAPKLFYRLGSFEVQVLRFAVKYNMLKEEMLDQIAYLSARTREREKDILPILEHGYVVFGGETILQAICSLLIQHACTDSRYFPYFKEAVEHGLRLTRLY
ncbi:MAG: hypothetical protein IJ711_08920, partial [Lachnospiraceae bacterium]|nr:hypothetical protein [Lachnospiraceae bacterium]